MHSSELVDFIGVESCVDMRPYLAEEPPRTGPTVGFRRTRLGGGRPEKEYPPPMELPATVMRKHREGGGRLVIVEEMMERHGQLRAHRSDGRLVLNLLSPVGRSEISGGDDGGGGVGVGDRTVEEPPAARECCQLRGEIGVNPCRGGIGVAGSGRPLRTS